MPPFLTTESIEDIRAGLTNGYVEAIVWKGTVPDTVMDAISAFDFGKITSAASSAGGRIRKGRDLWRKEAIICSWISDMFSELSCVDEHVRDIRAMFSDLGGDGPTKARHDAPPCHFVSADSLILANQTPHIDTGSDKKVYKGRLGSEWKKEATPANYPSFKIIATLNSYDGKATGLLPFDSKGEEDLEFADHFPSADLSEAEHAKPGDIVFLKQYVTVHYGPSDIESRWLLSY